MLDWVSSLRFKAFFKRGDWTYSFPSLMIFSAIFIPFWSTPISLSISASLSWFSAFFFLAAASSKNLRSNFLFSALKISYCAWEFWHLEMRFMVASNFSETLLQHGNPLHFVMDLRYPHLSCFHVIQDAAWWLKILFQHQRFCERA